MCWGSTHWLYISTIGLAFLILYVIGVPLGLYLTLKHNLDKVNKIIGLSVIEESEDAGGPIWMENQQLVQVHPTNADSPSLSIYIYIYIYNIQDCLYNPADAFF